MSTLIRPELSETNRYWIEKHRYYELKHFCLQYPLWRHAYNSLIDYPGSWPQLVPPCKTNVISDPVTKHIDERLYYADRMKMVERVAKETDEELSCYILEAITEGISYDHLKARTGIHVVRMFITTCTDGFSGCLVRRDGNEDCRYCSEKSLSLQLPELPE